MREILFLSLAMLCLDAGGREWKSYELGASLGATTYIGEANSEMLLRTPRVGGKILGRCNIHQQFTLEGSFGFMRLACDDAASAFAYQQQRDHRSATSLISLGAGAQFNFRKFKSRIATTVWTPYLTVGLGANMANLDFTDNFAGNFELPFGMGLKFKTRRKLVFGVECVVAKTFRDDLDALGEPLYDEYGLFPNKQKSNSRDRDWYSYLGVFITYRINGKNKCKAYT